MGGRGAVWAAIGLWAGLVLGAGTGSVVGAGCAAALLATFARRARPRTGAFAMACALLAAGCAREGARRERLATERGALASEAFARLDARVIEPPRRESDTPVALVRVIGAGGTLPVGARVRLRLPAECAAEWGDRVVALARIEPPLGRRNPGGFDARAAADAAGVAASGRAFSARVARARGLAHAPIRLAMRVRRGLERTYATALSPASRELVTPLVLGDRSAMSPELDAQFRASGLVHLLALSGLHVVWFAAVLRGLVGALGGGRTARALAGGVCALVYVAIAGPLPSLLRAAGGEVLAAVAGWRQRALDAQQSLALTTIGLLVWRPEWAADLGFQLSCAATLGLIAIAPRLERALRGTGRRGTVARVRAALAGALAPSLGAQLCALPLLLDRFHALPWTGLLANLLAVPVAEGLLAAAWLAGLAAPLAPELAAPWLSACEALVALLRLIASIAASSPGALLACGDEGWLAPTAALGALLLAAGASEPRTVSDRTYGPSRVGRAAIALGALACGLAIVGALTAREQRPRAGAWWLLALDVGQGDAIALGFPDGWWLIDAGPRTPHWDAGQGAVLPALRALGVRRLQALVLTHDDGDHTGGAAAVRGAMPVARVITSAPVPGVPGPARRFNAAIARRGARLREAPPVRVLWPPALRDADGDNAGRGDNAASLVLEVGSQAGRALLVADADSLVEAALAFEPGVALLKVGHHGSGSSSGATFVARAGARRAIVSCGRRNAYGHPHAGALARVAAPGTAIDRTDRDGAWWYELTASGARPIDWRAPRGRPPTMRAAGLAAAARHW